MTMNASLDQLAKGLEQKTLDLIQSGSWVALEAMIAPECQFVTNQGALNKVEAIALMKTMQLTQTSLRHVRATKNGDTLIVSFELACSELINGQIQSKDFSPRLSVWRQEGDDYLCVAYGDFNQTRSYKWQ